MSKNSFDGFSLLFSRLRLFLALSRTPHGLIDMTTPAFAALVWLGSVPSLYVVFLGLLTTFAGYTSVYALNDIVDYSNDKKKIRRNGISHTGGDLDAIFVRHPMALGLLTFREGLLWTFFWAAVAVICAYFLNPVCLLIFALGCLLEAIYCFLWKVSHHRVLISGAVKTLGAVAAVFAVDPRPSASFLTALFLCFFFWEIGAQNIPNDLTDLESDRQFGAKTVPVVFGARRCSIIILSSILIALPLNTAIFKLSPVQFTPVYMIAAFMAGAYLLLVPSVRLWFSQSSKDAMVLFNRGSYYPLALMGIVLVKAVT